MATQEPTAVNYPHQVQHRPLGTFILLSVITLGLYDAYLTVRWAADMNLLLGRNKYNSAIILILGIVSLTIGFVVAAIMYAFDIEKVGKSKGMGNRLQNIGGYVLSANVISLAIGFFSGGLAIFLSFIISICAFWLIQNEFNKFSVEQQSDVIEEIG